MKEFSSINLSPIQGVLGTNRNFFGMNTSFDQLL